MSFEPRDYLRHMLVEADYLIRESADIAADDFMSSETLQRAFVRSIEIMGEAAKNVPNDFREQYPDVDWRRLAGMRDRLSLLVQDRSDSLPKLRNVSADDIPNYGVVNTEVAMNLRCIARRPLGRSDLHRLHR